MLLLHLLDANNADLVSIESRDTETTIYPANPSAFPDKVGDGKYIRIDRDKPALDVINSMSVAITDGNDNDHGRRYWRRG